ncbi:MAG: tetratricopeptide repeat protein, partial [Cyanobacteria bacterium]|nr:tetratricopeptide repeat protein [Cyanobacteriota bacterium]
LLKRAAQIQELAYGKSSLEVVLTYLKLAETYADLNKLDLAIQMYKKTIPICEQVYGYSSLQVASASEAVAALEFKNGLDADAATSYKRCLKIYESDAKGTDKGALKKCLSGYAQVLKRLDKKNEAKQIEAKLAKLK